MFVSYGGHEVSGGGPRRGGDPEAAVKELNAAGVNAHYYVSPETGHEWLSWRRSLKEIAPLLFREGIDGVWHAQFETVIGLQSYQFNFQVEDGKLMEVTAVAESGGEKRDVEFVDGQLNDDVVSFAELRQIQNREIRIEYTGTLSETGIRLDRKVGELGSQQATATRHLPSPADPEPAAQSEPVSEIRIDRPIREAFSKSFRVGTAGDFPTRYSEFELAAAAEHFNAVTPENCMKPERVHPEENEWRFEQSDAMVRWAAENSQSIHGHTLVWHAQTGDWFFEGGDADVIRQRMRDHIHTLVGRYRGKIHSWDVVNEAISDGGNAETGTTENLRNSKWLQALGPEFLTLAFKFAHEADPDALLYYNDYNIESGPKHASSMVLLKRLIGDGAPIHAVGIQGHWLRTRSF